MIVFIIAKCVYAYITVVIKVFPMSKGCCVVTFVNQNTSNSKYDSIFYCPAPTLRKYFFYI